MSKFAMKLTAVAAMVVGFASLATAQTAASSTTRAAVVAEMEAARASGQMAAVHGEDSGSAWLNQQRSGRAPDAPSAGLGSAGVGGLAAALIGEDSGSFYLSASAHDSPRTRANTVAGVTGR